MAEDIIKYIENLVFQGKTQDEAIDHATHYFGKTREEIVRLLGQKDKA